MTRTSLEVGVWGQTGRVASELAGVKMRTDRVDATRNAQQKTHRKDGPFVLPKVAGRAYRAGTGVLASLVAVPREGGDRGCFMA